MCGRFVRTTPVERFAELFGADGHPPGPPSHNISPGARLLAARAGADGHRELCLLKWGLVPAWSDEPRTAYSTINARAETVADKPAYRAAFRQRRCLIAADGFYEWHPQPDGHKQPYFIRLADGPFAFAGIWEHWERDRQHLESCSIIVTAANTLIQPIHERMPDIRDRAALETNFRQHFEALNRVRLTDAEFARLLDGIVTADIFPPPGTCARNIPSSAMTARRCTTPWSISRNGAKTVSRWSTSSASVPTTAITVST